MHTPKEQSVGSLPLKYWLLSTCLLSPVAQVGPAPARAGSLIHALWKYATT